VLAKNIKFIDIDPDHIERALDTIRKRPPAEKTTLFVFYSENRVIHAVHSKKGPVRISEFRGPGSIKTLAKEFGVDRVVCLQHGAVRRALAGAQTKIKIDQTMLEQILAGRESFDREWGNGIHVYPDPLANVPRVPDFARRALRIFLPKQLLVMLVVFERDEVWTSLVLGVTDGEVSLVSTTDMLQPISLEGLDIPRKANRLTAALRRRHGRPTACIFMDRASFEHLAAHPKPVSALAELVGKKWALIHPFPSRLHILLALAPLLKI
jgi:hypothetical protein